MYSLTLKNNKTMLLMLFIILCSIPFIAQYANADTASGIKYDKFSAILDWFKNLGKDGSNSTTLMTVFGNLDGTFRAAIGLTIMVARIMAIYLAWTALVKLVRVSDKRETQGGLWMTLLSAGLMFSVVQMMDVLSNTLGMGKASEGLDLVNGTTMVKECSGLIATSCGEDGLWENTKKALTTVISLFRLAGIIAVVRGILALHEIGHGKGQATYGKVCVSMIAGAILYNCVPFAVMLTRQFAPGAEGFFLEGNGRAFIPGG